MGKINEIGIKIQQILKNAETDIRTYEIKVTEIEVDLGGVEIDKLDQKTREILAKQAKEDASKKLLLLVKRGGTPEQIGAFLQKTSIFKEFKSEDLAVLEKSENPQVPSDVIKQIKGLQAVEREEAGTLAIVGSDALMWPWEGDFWLDEIGSYRSFLKEVCAK
jgi:hypothetical protein